MFSNEPGTLRTRTPWSIAARLALWYTAATFVLVAVATGLLYWVLATNVDREDDQFLVDTAQIMRAIIRERPGDIAALQQEVDWEGAARRYARVLVRVLDEDGGLIIETPGATSIIARHTLRPADTGAEPGPGSPTGARLAGDPAIRLLRDVGRPVRESAARVGPPADRCTHRVIADLHPAVQRVRVRA
jgi:two-component system heavy metal sensor histidine kinase CusS